MRKNTFSFEGTIRYGQPTLTYFGNFTEETALLAHSGMQILQSAAGVFIENNDNLLSSLEFVRRDTDRASRLLHKKVAQKHHIDVWQLKKIFVNDDRYFTLTTCDYLEALYTKDELPSINALQIVQRCVNN